LALPNAWRRSRARIRAARSSRERCRREVRVS